MNAMRLFLVAVIIVVAAELCMITIKNTVPAMEKHNTQIDNIINDLEK